MPHPRTPLNPLAVLLALALVLPAVAAAQMPGRAPGAPAMFKPGPGPDELWEVTFSVEAMGMSMPPQTQQTCVRKGRREADLIPASDECTTSDLKTSGNRTTFTMTCRGDPPMTGTGDITSGPNEYKGRMTARSTRRGEEMTMVQNFSGRRIGTCTDTSEQVVAKIEADGKAMTAKACGEQMDALAPTLFEAGGACAAQRKQFCDKAASIAGGMREPAGHAAARQKYPTTLRAAFASCKVDYDGVSRTACAKAVETRNWNFVGGGPCDADVRAHAPTFCNTGPNRSPDPQYFALCSRYAALTRGAAGSGATAGTGGQPPAPSAAAEPPKPDPLKQGVDAVRRLLPF